MILNDSKARWLLITATIVILLEVLSLSGAPIPLWVSIPLCLIIILGIGQHTLYNGFRALLSLNFKSINLLMLIAVLGAMALGKFEEAAVVIVLYNLAERLEDLGIEKSRSALDTLISKVPQEATLKDGAKISVHDLKIGSLITIKPGEMIPVDGKVVHGFSSVDESTITGEPIPHDKSVNDKVFSGTLNCDGYLEVEVTKTAENSTLAKIKQMIYDSKSQQAKTQQFIEKFSAYYTPTIILLALGVMFIPPFFFHGNFSEWFISALTLLVIACPCALVISTPISIYSAIGKASSMGVLIKGGKYLEALGDLRIIAFDKTRTLTTGRPHVTDIIPFGHMDKKTLLSCAAGISKYSEHPISVGVLKAAQDEEYDPHPIENFQSMTGKGAKADCLVCKDSHHCMGKLKFILEEHKVPDEVFTLVDKLQNEGKTVIVVCTHEEVEGIIALEDKIKSDSKQLVSQLIERDVEPIMLTGDAPGPAEKIAQILGIQQYRSELLPEDKSKIIDEFIQKYKVVGMVGDGINDAPALARANVGISMSALGSDTALEAASVVLLGDNISIIPKLIDLGRQTLRIIKVNTIGAIAVKLVFVTLALLGMGNLVMAIFADVGVTLLVVLNSLRLMK